MAETVKTFRIEVKITSEVAGTDGSSLRDLFVYDYSFSEGTGTGQIGSVFVDDARPLNATNEDLDLAGGLTDFQGVAMALNNMKVLAIKNLDNDSGDTLTVGKGGSNPITTFLGGTAPTITVYEGGLLLYVAPATAPTVTGGSADTLNIAMADNSTYDILIAGDNA